LAQVVVSQKLVLSNVSGHKDGLQSASLLRDFPSHNMAAIIFGICYMLHSAGFSSQVW